MIFRSMGSLGISATQVSAVPIIESYYLLSAANKIFTFPTTRFVFRRRQGDITFVPLYEKLGLKRTTIASHPGLMGKYNDAFTSPDTLAFGNKKITDICERMIKYDIENRKEVFDDLTKLPKDDDYQPVMLGQEALEKNIVDGIGHFDKILNDLHPGCRLKHIDYAGEQFFYFQIFAMVTSPILVMIFLFKVALKWSIIFYVWLKAKA